MHNVQYRTEQLSFRSDVDGTLLSADLYKPDEITAPYVVAFYHGFGRCAEDYHRVGSTFARYGILTCLADMRSHGNSEGMFELDRMPYDMLTLAERLGQSECPVVVVGHSLAAYVLGRALAKDEKGVIKIAVMIEPPRKPSNYIDKFFMAELLGKPILDKVTKRPVLYFLKPFGVDRTEDDTLTFHRLKIHDPKKFLDEIMTSPDLVDLYNNGHRTDTPVLILCGNNDRIVKADDSFEIGEAMRTSGKRRKTIEIDDLELRHHLFQEEIDRVVHKTVEFAEYHLARYF